MSGPDGIESSVVSAEGLVRELAVTVKAAVVERECEQRLQEVGRSVALRGYRPGRIPRAVLQQRFGEQVRGEIIDRLVRSGLTDAIAELKLRPVGDVTIDAPAPAKGADLGFTARFEVLPDISLTGLEGIAVERPEPAIDAEDVLAALDNLRRRQARWLPVARPARTGDRVTVNSSGLVDGQQVEGLAGDGIALVLGEGQFLAEVEREIVGLAPGETRTAGVAIPADFGYADIAGRTVELTVEVLEVAEPELPAVDAAFARSVGVASGDLGELRAEVARGLAAEFGRLARAAVRRQLFRALAAANPVPVPAVLVDQEANNLKYAAMRNLVIVDPDKARPLAEFRPLAERRVRAQLLVNALVEGEGIAADPDQVRRRMVELGSLTGPAAPSAEGLRQQVEQEALEDAVGDWLEQRAAVTPKPMSYRELLRLPAEE